MSPSNWPINIAATNCSFNGKRIITVGNHADSIEVARSEHQRKRDRDEQAALDFRKALDELGEG